MLRSIRSVANRQTPQKRLRTFFYTLRHHPNSRLVVCAIPCLLIFFIFLFAPASPPTYNIWISIASFRDDECTQTIWNMFSQSAYPSRLHVSIYQQNGRHDLDCILSLYSTCAIIRSEISVDSQQTQSVQLCSFLDQISVTRVNASSSHGLTFARSELTRIMVESVEQDDLKNLFFLQLDSHMRFVKNWDSKLVSTWMGLQDERGVLTTYPDRVSRMSIHGRFDSNCPLYFCYKKRVPIICGTKGGVKEWAAHTWQGMKWTILSQPIRVPFFAGNFAFGKAAWAISLMFDAGEFSLIDQVFYAEAYKAMELWKMGFNLYAPDKNIVYHNNKYDRKKRDVKLRDEYSQRNISLVRAQKLLELSLSDTSVRSPRRQYTRSVGSYFKFWTGSESFNSDTNVSICHNLR